MVFRTIRKGFGRIWRGYKILRFVVKAGVVIAAGGYAGYTGLPREQLTTVKPLKKPGEVVTETGTYSNNPFLWRSPEDCNNIASKLAAQPGKPVRLKLWGWGIPYTPLQEIVTGVNYLNAWESMGGNYKQVSLKTPVEMTNGLENLFMGYQSKHGVGIIPIYTIDSSFGGYTLFAKPGSKLGPHVDPVTQMITDSVLNVGAPKK